MPAIRRSGTSVIATAQGKAARFDLQSGKSPLDNSDQDM
jgi:hypothetical protein